MNYRVRIVSHTEGHDGTGDIRFADGVFDSRIAALQCAFDLAMDQARSCGDGGCYIRSNCILTDGVSGDLIGFSLSLSLCEAFELNEPGMCYTYELVEVDYDFVFGKEAK